MTRRISVCSRESSERSQPRCPVWMPLRLAREEGVGSGRGGDPRARGTPESPNLFCLPLQTMDLHGGRRLGARPPAEKPSPPVC